MLLIPQAGDVSWFWSETVHFLSGIGVVHGPCIEYVLLVMAGFVVKGRLPLKGLCFAPHLCGNHSIVGHIYAGGADPMSLISCCRIKSSRSERSQNHESAKI